uniref:Phosphoinositide phospholipase C n=1 Tax=Amphimedon queenslandica TaxID=400682 RepID=A0A1X7VUT6_AMPQE
MADIDEEVTAETSPAQEPVLEEQQGQPSTTTSVSAQNDEPAQGEESSEPKPPAQEESAPEPGPDEIKKDAVPPSISGNHLKQLLVGTLLHKAKKGSKTLPRLYNISTDLVRLVWNSKRKPVAKAQIPLSQIQEVLRGRSTDSFKLHQTTSDENCCFSIRYNEGPSAKTLDLIAATPDEADLWINGLLALTFSGVSQSTSDVRKRWLRALFDESDENGDGDLSLREIVNMMKRLNVGISTKIIRKMFKEADSDGNSDQKLNFEEFSALFHNLANRPELKNLFTLYASSDEGSYMTIQDLTSFLVNAQNMSEVTDDYCQSIIERFEPSEEGKSKLLLSLDGFTQYMLSPDNDVFKRQHKSVYQDMTQPLSHYFIASSHNTYLLEDQLSGPSSVDAYIKALNKGCRCVELDCWDGDDNEPIIYHGHTLTSKILFKDVIVAIKEHAFTASPYPVILSIENHCGIKQQAVMAEHMIDIFGEMLHRDQRDEERGVLPSPEEMKYKILIKAKKLHPDQEDKSDGEGEVTDEDEAAEIDPEDIKKAQSSSDKGATADPVEPTGATGNELTVTGQPEARRVVESKKRSFRRRTNTAPSNNKPTAKRKLSSKLSKCVNYVQSVHFKGFDSTHEIPFFHMSSFGESSAFKSSEESGAHFLEYNKKHLSRTYPSGRRVDSSNYEPINMWNAGCQIVALNYQTPGKSMDWNMGKFQQNGGSGYVLKPEIMREDFAYFDHMDKAGPSGISPKVVTISIISGQQLPKPEGGSTTGEVIDPYVQIQFAGLLKDCAQFKTKVINDNGFNPVWNETFQKIVCFPELALIRFKVMDYDLLSKDDFIGQFTLPLDSIETGYRHIHLRNKDWELLDNATLFVHVTVEDLVAPSPKSKERLRVTAVKKSRQYTLMKYCQFPPIDNLLRPLNLTLKTGTDLVEDTAFATLLFKDACCKANLSESIEAMFQQAKLHNVKLHLFKTEGENFAYQVSPVSSSRSPSLHRMLQTFDRLNAQIITLLNISPSIITELESVLEEILQQKEEFNKSLSPLTPPKVQQAKAAYSFNIRTLKNDLNQLKGAVSKANDTLAKDTCHL